MSQKSVYSHENYTLQHQGNKKRTEFGQLLQILEHLRISNNKKISSIARFANMSHVAATRNCEKLLCAGLVEKDFTYGNKEYRLTSNGQTFLNECRNFGDFLNRYDLSHVLYY